MNVRITEALNCVNHALMVLPLPSDGAGKRAWSSLLEAQKLLESLSTEPGEAEEMVLVPRERTEAMHRAAQSTTSAIITHKHSAELWSAMLAAVPAVAVKPHYECASEDCRNPATVHFERGGIGSWHCLACYMRIQALHAAPLPEDTDHGQ